MYRDVRRRLARVRTNPAELCDAVFPRFTSGSEVVIALGFPYSGRCPYGGLFLCADDYTIHGKGFRLEAQLFGLDSITIALSFRLRPRSDLEPSATSIGLTTSQLYLYCKAPSISI